MLNIDNLTAFFAYCSAINLSILCLASLMLVIMRRAISRLHGKMFALSEADLARAYFQYLAQYKIAIFMFNIVPYIALRLLY
jgi:hypothetical protein